MDIVQFGGNKEALRQYWAEKKRAFREREKAKRLKLSGVRETNDHLENDLVNRAVKKVVDYLHLETENFSKRDKKMVLNGILEHPKIREFYDTGRQGDNLSTMLVNNLKSTLQSMKKKNDELVLKRSSLMMILKGDIDNPLQEMNISELAKLLGVTRKVLYATINRLSIVEQGTSLLKMTMKSRPYNHVTTEVKELINLFWKNESRVSPNKKDVCRRRLGRNRYEQHPVHLLDVSQVHMLISSSHDHYNH